MEVFFLLQILLFQKLLLHFKTKKVIFYHISNVFFVQFSKRWSKITRKVQLLNFGWLPVCQFSLDFSTKSDLGYFYLYLQLFLGSTKSGMSGEQRGKMRIMVSTLKWKKLFIRKIVTRFLLLLLHFTLHQIQELSIVI